MNKSDLIETECHCDDCIDLCDKRVCWPTPKEAQTLIDHGFKDRLMVDYWAGDDFDIVCPAIIGFECERAPSDPRGKCTFLMTDGLCELHKINFKMKPLEGRLANGCKKPEIDYHEYVAMMWNSDEGKKVAEQFDVQPIEQLSILDSLKLMF